MNILITYIIVIIISSISIESVIKWFLYNENSKNNKPLNISNAPLYFITSQLWSLSIGFCITYGAHIFLYYENDLLITLTLFLGLISFCWSPFNKFKSNNVLFPFILGMLSFYSYQFLWIFPLVHLIYLILLNNIELSYLFSCATLLLSPLFLDTKPWTEILILGIVAILAINFNKEITRLLNGNPTTLITLFKKRT